MIDVTASAVFSSEDPPRYRPWLRRDIDMLGGPPLVSCGYNPSRAGFVANDPTIRREIALCQLIGCSTLIKVNVFTAISPYPDDLAGLEDPVGPQADEALLAAAELCKREGGIMLACWGVPKGKAATKRLAEKRFAHVRSLGLDWHCLRLTASGYPEHPLYLPSALRPVRWDQSTTMISPSSSPASITR